PNRPGVAMPFKALGLHPALVQAVRQAGYAEPTPVQAQAIPAVLAGRDLVATAQTGTGKTAAFLLPILHQLLGLPRGTSRALVIPEADRMLDMGFLPDLKRIIARLPGREQTLLFSATMPPVIARLAREILRDPLTIQVGRRDAPAVGITQAAYPVAEHLKIALLRHLLRNMEMPSVLVFTRTKHLAKRLARVLETDGFAVAELHSNRSQSQRTRA